MLGFGQIQQELSRGPAIAAISVAVADFWYSAKHASQDAIDIGDGRVGTLGDLN